MLLSKQQRYVLEVVDKLGCVTKNQLTALVRSKFCTHRPEIAEKLTESMLRQLSLGNAPFSIDGKSVKSPIARNDPLLPEAVDVMLELSGNAPLEFSANQISPVLLRFSVNSKKIMLFAVISAGAWGLHTDPKAVFSPTERIIILQDGGESKAKLTVPNKCFHAVLQADGTHKFFEF